MALKEMAVEYRQAAHLLRNRLKELRLALKLAKTSEDRWRLQRRISELTPMLTHTNKVAALLEHYYERGYYRDPEISVNAFDWRLQGGAQSKETITYHHRERADGIPAGYVSSILCRRFYDPGNRGTKRRKQEHGVSHAEKSRIENTKVSSVSLETDADIQIAIDQFLHKKEK